MWPRSRRVGATHGLSLHLLEWSAQGEALILLHGFGHDAHVWDPFAAALALHYQTLALDQRGHGESDHDPEARYSHESMTADLAAVVDGLELERVTLVGHSMGGYNALRYAAEQPARVTRLVLVEAGPELMSAAIEKGRTGTGRSRSARARIDPALLRTRIDQEEWTRRESARLWSALTCVACPTLVVRGERSATLTRGTVEKMVHHGLRDGRLEEIPEAGHAVMRDNPEAFRASLQRFLLV